MWGPVKGLSFHIFCGLGTKLMQAPLSTRKATQECSPVALNDTGGRLATVGDWRQCFLTF